MFSLAYLSHAITYENSKRPLEVARRYSTRCQLHKGPSFSFSCNCYSFDAKLEHTPTVTRVISYY